jgi:hypothetical protein
VQGVSTRSVDDLVQAIGMSGIFKSQVSRPCGEIEKVKAFLARPIEGDLLRTTPTREVRIHPDGEHGKRFDFAGWLGKRGFDWTSRSGGAEYGGSYTLPDGRRIAVNPTASKGDVVAEIDGLVLSAECKGGNIDTRHSGQVSRLSKGRREAVGLLMASQSAGAKLASCAHERHAAARAAAGSPLPSGARFRR